AAAGRDDAGAAARLDRALHGSHPPGSRPAGGGRRVAVLARPEIEEALIDAGHAVEPLVPGTARAVMARVEVAVLDLEGFTGVWGGALDAEGVGLAREVMTAVEEGARRGVTTWLAAGTGVVPHSGGRTAGHLHAGGGDLDQQIERIHDKRRTSASTPAASASASDGGGARGDAGGTSDPLGHGVGHRTNRAGQATAHLGAQIGFDAPPGGPQNAATGADDPA
ncbi:hypothetical protein LB570_29495, partial [Mesorhizobium sp. BR1-1-5]|nr:hypothetical protein [Mesorhizobium sp. BR1-1-5]